MLGRSSHAFPRISRKLWKLAAVLVVGTGFSSCDTGQISLVTSTNDEAWADTELRIVSPEPGAILYLEHRPHRLEAVVVDEEGLDTGFNAVEWDLAPTGPDATSAWTGRGGLIFSDLPTGVWNLTAAAVLPNNDKMQVTYGGVRVQGLRTGVYSGSITVRIDSSQGIGGACVGPLEFIVGWDGVAFQGPSFCTIDTGFFALDVDMTIDGNIDGSTVQGDLGIDVGGWFQIPIPYDGEALDAETLTGRFTYAGASVTAEGEWEAHRVTALIE